VAKKGLFQRLIDEIEPDIFKKYIFSSDSRHFHLQVAWQKNVTVREMRKECMRLFSLSAKVRGISSTRLAF